MSAKQLPSYRFYSTSRNDLYGETHAQRRVRFLRLAANQKVRGYFNSVLRINCEGGVSQHHPDLKWLLKRGYVRIHRDPDGRLGHGGGTIRTTMAKITEAGWAALWNETL